MASTAANVKTEKPHEALSGDDGKQLGKGSETVTKKV